MRRTKALNGDLYQVLPFSLRVLRETLAALSGAKTDYVATKPQFEYLYKYVSSLLKDYSIAIGGQRIPPGTLIVEPHYVDRDFLEDFSSYYVRCFNPCSSTCARIHFFTGKFETSDLEALLRGEPTEFQSKCISNDRYLGFIVVKPLPETLIGRTCLRQRPESDGRKFPVKRQYEVHLFGQTLKVDSVAFQEQDRVVSACATSAMWSAFHGTSHIFKHSIPSPVEITKSSFENAWTDDRSFPNNQGLYSEQMAQAIRCIGLEPLALETRFVMEVEVEASADVFQADVEALADQPDGTKTISCDHNYIKAICKAYLAAGIPVILICDILDFCDVEDIDPNEPDEDEELAGEPEFVGAHAVTVLGYKQAKDVDPLPLFVEGPRLRSSAIQALYAHDDGIGPFSTLTFESETAVNPGIDEVVLLKMERRNMADEVGTVSADTRILMIPLYHKIRITFTTIHDAVTEFNQTLIQMFSASNVNTWKNISWDIRLQSAQTYKVGLSDDPCVDPEVRRFIQASSMPKYVWLAEAFDGDNKLIDLVFDATDVEQGDVFLTAVPFDKDFWRVLQELDIKEALNLHQGPGVRRMIEWFME